MEQELQGSLPGLAPEGVARVTLPIAVNADSLATWFAPALAAYAAQAAIKLGRFDEASALANKALALDARLLVLDEPTNHLDLPAIEQLEQALDTFGGTVLLVTHDRSLLESVRITRTITMENGRLTQES